jgi:hypothetical protein
MTYVLTVCLGMFTGICGTHTRFEYPTLTECETAKAGISTKSIGTGYAICAPKMVQKEPNKP